ncbi:MAG: gliding motility-associated C-terminal domain-containing protein [Bacteroidota bacterium]
MRKILFILFLFHALGIQFANASHNRAGEITYRHISANTYEITITTYTKTSSSLAQNGSVDRPTLDSVHMGDGSIVVFHRDSMQDIPGDIRINKYIETHLYPGAGIDTIWFVDPNRNGNVINVPNSFFTPFAIYTILYVGLPGLADNSPILLNPPIDSGCVGIPFLHNPAASDPDHDSLSYQLIFCHGADNLPIPDYTYPSTTNTFTLNAVTGDLIWDSPDSAGEYNVAFLIISWRKFGNTWLRIGEVERDMQIRIITCPQSFEPPVILPVADTCILAGDTLAFNVTAYDPNHDFVTLTSVGSPYINSNPASFTIPANNNSQNDTINGLFTWHTNCDNIASQPYQVTFRASDINSTISLVTYESVIITVIAPPIDSLSVEPNGNTMMLHWSPSPCSNVDHYNIYHRVGQYPGVIECPCQTGVPSFTDYILIGTATGLNDTAFVDSNNGAGLAIGISHCYMVTAVFADGSESCTSIQVCNKLKKDLPVITNVSVVTTNSLSGTDSIIWSKATEIDTNVFHSPYQYKIYRSDNDFFGTNFILVHTMAGDENDTIYLDNSFNTVNKNSYKIELYYDSDNNGTPDALKGSTQTASSVFLSLVPSDQSIALSWQENVPWTNSHYDIFKLNAANNTWDSIATTTQHSYIDSDSILNGSQYCYYVRSYGGYGTPGIIDPIINLSQQVCAIAHDNVPPCAPVFTVGSDCLENVNFLHWNNPNHSCADDVWYYKIYFAQNGENLEPIDTIHLANDTTFVHLNLSSLAGCYKVTAVDSNFNESTAIAICVDTCRQYVLPSVFTPNGDHNNDLFHPCDSTTANELQIKNCPPYKNVFDIDLKIYNRWGSIVFETTDKDINWDGTNKFSKGDCPDGVYYYTCIVNFIRLNGIESKQLHGYIHLIRGN